MALSSSTVWEVRPSGVDTNGGGFVTGATGTNWTLQNTAQYSVTDGVTAGTTTITSATAAFGTDVVGNVMYVQGGTGSVAAGWYQITVRNSATSVTVDRSTGLTAGTGVTLHIGGALATPGVAGSVAATGNIVYLFNAGSTTYVITSASTNVAGGCVSSGANFIGYATNRSPSNTDSAPVLQLGSGVSTATIFNSSTIVVNLVMDGNNQTSSKAQAGGRCTRSTAKNFTLGNVSTATCDHTIFTGNSATCLTASAEYCEFYGNTTTPTNGGVSIYVYCIFYNNTGATTDGASAGSYYHCIFYGNGRDGVRVGNLFNCIAEGNGGWGFNPVTSSSSNGTILDHNAHYNNGLGGVNTTGSTITIGVTNTIALTASPFVNAAGNNFAITNTAGGGALLRGLGYGAFPRGTTVGYPDIGAAQHADPVAPQTARIYGE